MALAFTYRLTAQARQEEAPSPQPATAAGFAAALHGRGGPVTSWSPEPHAPMLPLLAPPPDLLAHGAIGTNPAAAAHRPDSGLGFSCLDLLAGLGGEWAMTTGSKPP